MIVDIHHRCSDFDSYRAAAVKSLFNVETGANFDLTVDLPLHERTWQIGVVVGSFVRFGQDQYWQKVRQNLHTQVE